MGGRRARGLGLVFALLAACEGRPPAPATACDELFEVGRTISLPGGTFEMGAAPLYREEGPPQRVHVSPFAMLAHEVTNDQFGAFVAATGYLTDAERSAARGIEGGGSALFSFPEGARIGQWRLEPLASWRTPEGAGSSLEGRGRHPVVHVSLNDARAFAAWAGGRLPSEVEWEYAAASGLLHPAGPLSGAFGPDGAPLANIWTGAFPFENTAADGFRATAPVGCYPADRNGVHDLIGNVWEWTDTPAATPGQNVIKGGSHLCAANYCARYRSSAREDHEVDFSASHIGFRIVRDLN
jgi:formylglycine-generating enzyme required for sulfatase activity